eukprot:TRINITY_DN7666_c0_g1_i2.p2 TRINITY_DN7666_c0_g1~~TRINITY_DN7666_c0_g1_i2.p2  ORF type:complete len:234 (+),score=14.24 TRINITY_DN7666_c0_g1_i2:208-909(+)
MILSGSKRSLQLINRSRVIIFNTNLTQNIEDWNCLCSQLNNAKQLFNKQSSASQLQQLRTRYHSKGILFEKWIRQGQYFTLNPSIDKFINCIMKKGKKELAFKIFRETCNMLQKIYPDNAPGEIIKAAIDNVKPIVEVRRTKLAGRTRHIPLAIPARRQHNMAIRWILKAARDRKLNVINSFSECLTVEIIDAYLDKGAVKKRRAELHRLAEGGRSMIRKRWWKKTIEFPTPV